MAHGVRRSVLPILLGSEMPPPSFFLSSAGVIWNDAGRNRTVALVVDETPDGNHIPGRCLK